nr:hypothetical protein [Anaerolineae bacterium]
MKKTLVLYRGSLESDETVAERMLAWSNSQPNIEVITRSVHDDPAAVVLLGITEVPALTVEDRVIAQGSPEAWLTESFLRSLTHSIDC